MYITLYNIFTCFLCIKHTIYICIHETSWLWVKSSGWVNPQNLTVGWCHRTTSNQYIGDYHGWSKSMDGQSLYPSTDLIMIHYAIQENSLRWNCNSLNSSAKMWRRRLVVKICRNAIKNHAGWSISPSCLGLYTIYYNITPCITVSSCGNDHRFVHPPFGGQAGRSAIFLGGHCIEVASSVRSGFGSGWCDPSFHLW